MSYKYYYRIDFYHPNKIGPSERGSIICQCRNSRMDRKLMRKIERYVDMEMCFYGCDDVRAMIYRLDGEFTDTATLLDCTGYLMCIYAELRLSFATKRMWFDATSNPQRFYDLWTDELPEEVKNSGHH